MATVYIALGVGSSLSRFPAMNSIPLNKASLSSSGTAARASLYSTSQNFKDGPVTARLWTIVPIGGNVWVKFGDKTVEAAVGEDHYCKAGEPRIFAVTNPGVDEFISVIDAA